MMSSRTSEGKHVVRGFFPETRMLTSYTTYASDRLKTREGVAKSWYDDGAPRSEGQFANGERTGTWKEYSFGKEQWLFTGMYSVGKKTGLWKRYNSEGRLLSETTYVDGLREGSFVIYDSLSNVKNRGEYRADTVFQSLVPEEKKVETMPRFVDCGPIGDVSDPNDCANTELLKFIYSNIKYPAVARENDVQGMVIATFVVQKDGTIKDIHIIQGICQSMASECRRVIDLMPKWEVPGMQDGEAVNVQFNLPIKFKLE